MIRTRELSSADKQVIRRQVYERDGRRCVECAKLLSWTEMELHHIKPRSLGGGWELDNLATLCHEHHAAKKG